MISEMLFTESNFNVIFERQLKIRRRVNEFEDALQENYFQPKIIPIPDEIDPEIPRIAFDSKHGFSKIKISEISASLKVTYSEDWQKNSNKCQNYLNERIPILLDLLKKLSINPLYVGLETIVQIPCDDEEALKIIFKKYLKPEKVSNFQNSHDVVIKLTTVEEGMFYKNIQIRNYRIWKSLNKETFPRLPRNGANSSGILISLDLNDRYLFNEKEGYSFDNETFPKLIYKSFKSLLEEFETLKEK